jgi:hypothetical protein
MTLPGLRNLCMPAILYLGLSMIVLIIMVIQNVTSQNVFCLGQYSCDVSSAYMVIVMKFVYIIFWTWILNLICRSGSPSFAWFLVLFPFILFFILIALFMITPATTGLPIPLNI